MDKKSWLIFGVLVVFAVGAVLFFIQQQKIIPAQNQNPENLNKETSKQFQDYPQHIEAIPGNTDEVWYNIPELGVQMKLNKEFAEDLLYITSNEKGSKPDTAYFTSKKLYANTPNCAFGSIGNITIIQNELKTNETVPNTIPPERIKSFSGFDVVLFGPTTPYEICWDPTQDNGDTIKKVFTEKKDLMSSGFKNLQPISSK